MKVFYDFALTLMILSVADYNLTRVGVVVVVVVVVVYFLSLADFPPGTMG